MPHSAGMESISTRIANLEATIRRLETTHSGGSFARASRKGQNLADLRRKLFGLERLLRQVEAKQRGAEAFDLPF